MIVLGPEVEAPSSLSVTRLSSCPCRLRDLGGGGGGGGGRLDAVAFMVNTFMDSISILAEYASPNAQLGSDIRFALIDYAAG